MTTECPKIYNLFQRLIGSMDVWCDHLPRIKAMGFNWVYLNPFHYPGYSGSLYAVKDYYAYHPLFINSNLPQSPEQQLRNFLDEAHALGLKVMMDLVINHTAFDSILAETQPEWFLTNEDGSLKHPGCMDGDNWVEWGDLVQLDNASGAQGHALWQYWLQLVNYYMDLGMDGFRCDAAYHVPAELWDFIIRGARLQKPDVVFFAETLGCRPYQLIEAAMSGFDYVFNSVRWWDYQAEWFLGSHLRVLGAAPSIGFPESHDTVRAADELNGLEAAVKQKYAFSALFSTGVMMPVGFEYGFTKQLNVVDTYPVHWETPRFDLTGFISDINRLKSRHPIFQVDAPTYAIPVDNDRVRAILKCSTNGLDKCLFLLNLDHHEPQSVHIRDIADIMGCRQVQDISLGDRLNCVDDALSGTLAPAACQLILGTQLPSVSKVEALARD